MRYIRLLSFQSEESRGQRLGERAFASHCTGSRRPLGQLAGDTAYTVQTSKQRTLLDGWKLAGG